MASLETLVGEDVVLLFEARVWLGEVWSLILGVVTLGELL